ncbi:MAG: hypothetical protein JSR82_07110 [Verrucomicrobia bacterium]|nr:hypothetical protein [Verrucomicrobiota bacterium]
MKALPLVLVSSDEFWALEGQFHASHDLREGHLPLDDQAKNYDRFYDILVRHLEAIGTHSEGFLEGDFSTDRYVDPTDVTVVVSDTESVFRCRAIDAAFNAIKESGAAHMVIFDTGSYIAVLPDGRVIGYSEGEDLRGYDRARVA